MALAMGHFRSLLVALVAGLIFIVPAARAEDVSALDLLDAKTDYTADYYLSMGAQGEYRGTVIHAPARERRQFATANGSQVVVVRRDIGEATVMWPERKWYLSVPMETVSSMIGHIDGATLSRNADGSETVAGERCTRYEVTSSDGSFTGRMWFTRDGILMKAKGKMRYQGRDTPVETGLSHLLRVKADSAAFLLPSDYKGMPLDPSKLGLKLH